MSYREGAEKYYDLFGDKTDGPFYIGLARKTIDEHNMVVRTGYHSTDPEKRLMTVNLWYEHYVDGRMTERYFEGGEVYVHTPEGIKGLLEETGYSVEAWYGGHEGQAFTDESDKMVVVARPA